MAVEQGGPRAPRRPLAVVAAALSLLLGLNALVVATPALPARATPTSSTPTTTPPTTGPPTTTTTQPADPGTPTTTLPGTPPATPEPPTTVPPPPDPPPPPFGLPMDAGTRYMAELEQATADVARLEPEVVATRARRDRLQHAWDRLVAALDDAQAKVARTERALAATHDRIQQLAAQAYMRSTPARVTAAMQSVASANDVVAASRDLVIIDRYGSQETDVAHEYEVRKRELDREVARINHERVDMRGRLDEAAARYDDTQRAYDDAVARRQEATDGIRRFHELAVNSASPILGPNLLTAEDLAAFVTSNGHHPHLSVPIEELAKIYIEESSDEGVRGDVMWAQSILETGWFGYAGSMVGQFDNNFAGIGACDSCDHGFVFPSARIGVRAQVQGLKIYVDREYGPDNTTHDIVRPGMLRLGFRGKVHSWWDLTGRWATARNYGPRVYDIYMQMVAFARARHPSSGG